VNLLLVLNFQNTCKWCTINYFGSGTDPKSLLTLLFLFLLERHCSKKANAPLFQIGSGWYLAGLFLCKYALFPIWHSGVLCYCGKLLTGVLFFCTEMTTHCRSIHCPVSLTPNICPTSHSLAECVAWPSTTANLLTVSWHVLVTSQMSNVENIYRRRHRLRVRIGRKNVSRCHMQQSMDGWVFRCALEVVMVVEHLIAGDKRVPDSWCHVAECLGLELDPCRQLIE